MLDLILPSVLITFFLSLLLNPVVIRIAKILNLMDDPKKHNHPAIIHSKPIPRAGGLSIYIAILISSLIFLPLNKIFISMLFAGFIVVVLGLFDDKYDLSPYARFIINILCAAIVVFSGVNIFFVTNPFGGILNFSNIDFSLLSYSLSVPLGSILAIIWIVWVMNMLNWSKGVDGQMPGIAAVSAIIIGLASLRFPILEPMNMEISKMAFIVAGAALGFLVFNFYPAKIFPGYSATILGFLIGSLSIIYSVKIATAFLVMGVPMVDAFFTITRRILSKKSPFLHDRGHLHHILLDLGLSQRAIAIFYWVMSMFLGYVALNFSTRGKLFAIMLLIIIATGFIIMLRFAVKSDFFSKKESLERKRIAGGS